MMKVPHDRLVRLQRWLLAAVMTATATLAMAATEPFTEERFHTLQAQGALVLIDVHADWCPTCAKQQKALDAYQAARPNLALHRLVVDFDTQKEWVKHFKAPRQSTLLLYRGTEQRWFSVAETRSEEIFKAIDQAAGATP
jgi:thiol-disulfide isomerase/thioredoxin